MGKRPTFGQYFFVDISALLSDKWAVASDKHGSKVTVRVDQHTLPAIAEVMKARGVMKLSDFVRQAIANELARAHEESEERELKAALRRKQLEQAALGNLDDLQPRFELNESAPPSRKGRAKSAASDIGRSRAVAPVPKPPLAG